MARILGAGVLILLLAGCATSGTSQWWRSLAGLAPAAGRFHFDWRIAGDPSVAPLQVFDDGRQTWLQYPATQSIPAFFERTGAGDRLLLPRREGDYLVLSDVPAHIVVRGGHLQAQVWRMGSGSPSAQGAASGDVASVAAVPVLEPEEAQPAGPALADASGQEAGHPSESITTLVPPASVLAAAPPLLTEPPPLSPAGATPVPGTMSAVVASGATATPEPASGAGAAGFRASPADGNIRRALARWAGTAGWVFEPEHWAVDVDIPLAGSATFDADFVPAVRDLLAATELGERPLQPCFYANRVLRVVPLAQRCDRTQAPAGVRS